MIALAVVLSAVVLLLAVLVAGLLRSHADILRALHELGAGVGDPSAAGAPSGNHRGAGRARAAPLRIGPPLAGGRDSDSAPPVAGRTPAGDAVAVDPSSGDGLTLLAFLSGGCATCGAFWSAFHRPAQVGFPDGVRLVVVTKGVDHEAPGEVSALAPPGLTVVMSSEAWTDYEVPGSPFFALVDGPGGRRIGEGVANHPAQVAELVRRALLDAGGGGAVASGRRSRGLDGPARERATDEELLAAGILPGDPSLYPSSLADIYEPGSAPGPGSSAGYDRT